MHFRGGEDREDMLYLLPSILDQHLGNRLIPSLASLLLFLVPEPERLIILGQLKGQRSIFYFSLMVFIITIVVVMVVNLFILLIRLECSAMRILINIFVTCICIVIYELLYSR